MPVKVEPKVTKITLHNYLQSNPGLLVIKLGADWCAPCKKIEAFVHAHMRSLPQDTSVSLLVDIDESFELYGFLKTKKIVNGIPVLLAYYQGNTHYVPDDVVVGADEKQIKFFFDRCQEQLKANRV